MNAHRSPRAATLLFGIALCALRADPGEPDAPDILPASDSPLGAAGRLLSSYRLQGLDEYAALLLPDYRFIFGDSALRAAHPEGFSREDEIASAGHFFDGFTDASGIERPAARSIEISLDTLWVEDEPGKPDSAAQYQVVVARNLRINAAMEDGSELVVDPACHEFHFVRGDVAARGPDQPGDADHWYLWRWVESLSCGEVPVAGAGTSRSPPREPAAADPGAPVILGVPNPARGAVTVWARLPGREPARLEAFDVAGRRVLERDLGVPELVVSRVVLAGVVSLPAGVYWLRLRQGGRVGPARAIVLR